MTNSKVEIDNELYLQLVQSHRILQGLEALGVDSWEGYEEAIQTLNEEI